MESTTTKAINILFVCGRNQWRSPTAVQVYRNDQRVNVRSAGVSEKSRRRIGQDDLDWADLILVMERGYRGWIREKFPDQELPRIECLDIPDDFQYMDEELIDLVRVGTEIYIA